MSFLSSSVMPGGAETSERFIEALSIPLHAASLGGVETLVIRPAVTAYADVDPAERQRLGVTDSLVRMSVGIEDPADLIADLRQALDRAAPVHRLRAVVTNRSTGGPS